MNRQELAKFIDHTLLKATASEDEISKLCKEAKEFKFAAVCVNPSYVKFCSDLLKGTEVKVATVIGFPLGANTAQVKAFEAKKAVEDGAEEVDMVINIGALKSGDLNLVLGDIKGVVQAAKPAITKVIIETCYLTEEEKKIASGLVKEAGAHFVKTSTGFGTGGATVEDVKLIRSVVGNDLKIKASGGIRSFEDARKMIEAGADRLGTSSGVKIMEEFLQIETNP
ncbi:MAG: deoxyribose-phosphate aldolase [Caldiserica bacterium]|jgi:deoxyribose-phosphate aldolase|nr:deoxyribose-phosphate aldolase [Caldisericota bacterium]MDH7563239.1 deoxyribose-phosphate aldolase [Caldisericota bacterium]